jgi:4-amino-4-deoxy-L-arabinose transferase-like glycosyltransferase
MVVGVVLRAWHFSAPPDDAHAGRQTVTLVFAQSYSHGASWLAPRGSWFGSVPKVAVLEFPIYSLLTWMLARATGTGLVVSGRILSIAFGLLSLLVFDRILALRGHPRRNLAVALLALSPAAVFYSHADQPEGLLLLLMLVAAYAMVRSLRSPWLWTVASAMVLALACVIKPTALFYLLPVLAYLHARNGSRWRAALIALAALSATAMWAAFVAGVSHDGDAAWYALNYSSTFRFGSLSDRVDPTMYATISLYYIAVLMIPATIGLVVAAARNRLGDPLWWCWAAGGVAAILILSPLYWKHFYYHLPIVPALCALAAAAAPRIPRGAALRALVTVAAVVTSVAVVGFLTSGDPLYHDAGMAAAARVPPGRPIALFGDGPGDQMLFFADRVGISGGPTSNAVQLDQFAPFTACDAVLFTTTVPRLPSDWTVVLNDPRFVVAQRTSGPCSSP